MTLTYQRQENGEHAFVDESGQIRLWRGWSAWYGRVMGRVVKVCPVDWSDGDAIQFFHVRRRLGR